MLCGNKCKPDRFSSWRGTPAPRRFCKALAPIAPILFAVTTNSDEHQPFVARYKWLTSNVQFLECFTFNDQLGKNLNSLVSNVVSCFHQDILISMPRLLMNKNEPCKSRQVNDGMLLRAFDSRIISWIPKLFPVEKRFMQGGSTRNENCFHFSNLQEIKNWGYALMAEQTKAQLYLQNQWKRLNKNIAMIKST